MCMPGPRFGSSSNKILVLEHSYLERLKFTTKYIYLKRINNFHNAYSVPKLATVWRWWLGAG
jgi:hypothetical protein